MHPHGSALPDSLKGRWWVSYPTALLTATSPSSSAGSSRGAARTGPGGRQYTQLVPSEPCPQAPLTEQPGRPGTARPPSTARE